MTLLTAFCAFTVLAALVPIAGWVAGRRRADSVRRVLGLAAPTGRRRALRILATAGAIAALGLAAAQPALTHNARVHERTGVEALFVFDTSRSMAASATPKSPTRLDRAVAAAVRLRAAISDVPSGVATLTDRVLPDLGPVADTAGFDAVAERGVAIESPPPADTSVRATTYTALGDIAAGNYFGAKTTRRIVILLTDGESNPVDTGELQQTLPSSRGYRFVAVRFWSGGESVYDENGRRETAYRPDPLGRVVLHDTAAALGGRAFVESEVGAAASYLQRAAGSGATTPVATAQPSRTPLAPYLAAVALALLVAAVVPLRAVQFAAR